MARRLVLWDVDGTLIRSGGLGRDAFVVALRDVLGRPVHVDDVQLAGKTDPQIARELLVAAGVRTADVDRLLPRLLAATEAQLARDRDRLPALGHVLPGVEQLLARFSASDDVHQALLTGNTRHNAAVKVAAFGLDRFLDLDAGAYGSDHHDRTCLVPVAVDRARPHGFSGDAADVWVVGDTPNDLACARAGGARCLLVATGGYRRDELDGLGADAVRDDLAAVDDVAALLAA
jgi:phosphoglycolate phosphatase-like HAD superfamily hydrolase